MWCDYCSVASFSVQTTRRITKDGKEILIQYCGNCMHRIETEFNKRPLIRIKNEARKSNER